ncbi:hypothetical protein M231_00226 [Tremella mesenterica]|uniref:VWFA domain-containing protein n=1 Tax=Tremella mesenterica TaxID=5217 RepID=A0A4Q1BWV7_TREME|nr:hypothetical protein M231_00226 [Tremella mesenterica]
MPLESCMLVLDNSEYMRNGDYPPTRFQAQAQAVSTVFTAKTDSNPESAVGLMTMAGKSPSLLVTPTNDIGKLLSAMGKASIGGDSDFSTAVQIAQLALKHRENKNQRQRVIVFVGSPVSDPQEALVKLGKKLRKNNVLVDVVTFGEEGMKNDEKLGALIEAAGGGESHLVSIPPGPHLLSDMIISSLLADPNNPVPIPGQVGEDAVDPNMDPELAMAIRMSLQEAAAQQTSSSSAVPSAPQESVTTTSASLPVGLTAPLSNANVSLPQAPGDVVPTQISGGIEQDETMEEEDDEAALRRAIAMSNENGGEDVNMDEDEEDEEAAMARAIAMSLEDSEKDKEKK